MKPIAVVLEALRLAPSGHNTQPWRVELRGERALGIGWDGARWPRVADGQGEVLACSLGCAVEAAALVAKLEHERLPKVARGTPAAHAGELWIDALRPRTDELLALLRARRTHRAPFTKRALDAALLARLVRAGSVHGAEAIPLLERGAIERMARWTALGANRCLRDPAYLDELLRWIRLSPPFEDGFSPATLGLDPLTRRVVAWLQRDARARRLAPRLGLARLQAGQAAYALRRSAALVAITSADGWAEWVRGGRAAMALWLEATRAGLGAQPVHFPLLIEAGRRALAAELGLAPERRVLTLFRVGWPARPAPASGRLPLARICAGADLAL